jgi:hypothetical protein
LNPQSKADIALGSAHVRFTPKSGHRLPSHDLDDAPQELCRRVDAQALLVTQGSSWTRFCPLAAIRLDADSPDAELAGVCVAEA